MRTRRILVAAFAVWLSGFGAFAETRTFTNRQGQTIEAEITTVRNGKVYLEQAGRRYAVAFDQFSEPDQVYIRKWVKDNFDYRLLFQAVETELKEKRKSDRDRNARVNKEWETWRYDIKITNRSGIDLENLKVQYMVVVRDTHIEDRELSRKKKEEKPTTFSGTAEIGSLPNTDSETISTREVALHTHEWQIRNSRIVNQSSDNPRGDVQYYWDEYADEEQLDGVWVRIYLEDRMIAEWKSEGKLIKEVTWKGGGAPGVNVAAAPNRPAGLPPGLREISKKITEKSREVSRDPRDPRLRRELEALLKERVALLKDFR